MTDDEWIAALCRLTALDDAQLDGLERLASLSADELAEFEHAARAAWDENRQAIQDAKSEIIRLRRAQAATEVRVGNAARRRNPQYPLLTDAEMAELQRSREIVEDAKRALEAAGERFKAGVTSEQIAAVAG